MSYTRRQELICTLEEFANYANVVLYKGEALYVLQTNGKYGVIFGDGKTPIGELPYSINYEEYAELLEQTENAMTLAQRAKDEAELERQKAETEAQNAAASAQAAAGAARAEVANLQSQVDRNAKRLTNVESAIYGDLAQEVVDGSVAKGKGVPANAAPNAAVNMVGGMTRKCENLIKTRASSTMSGVTATVSNDGTITFDGTTTAGYNYYLYNGKISAGTYYINWNGVVSSANLYVFDSTDSKVIAVGSQAFTVATEREIVVYVNCTIVGKTLSGSIRPMLNAGPTALPYEPYFEGLRSAAVTEIESVGANLIPFPYADMNTAYGGGNMVANADGGVSFSGTPNALAYLYLYRGAPLKGVVTLSAYGSFSNIRAFLTLKNANNAIIYDEGTTGSITCDLDAYPSATVMEIALIRQYNGVAISGTCYVMLNKGTTALPYTPYAKHTLPIPEAVRSKPWYGLGISKDVCNAIRYNEDGSRSGDVKCGAVDLGTPNYTVYASDKWAVIPRITRAYSSLFIYSHSEHISEMFTNQYGDIVISYDGDFANAADIKAALSGVMLVYELANPYTEDISDILPADNVLPVEGGGTVTAVSEYGYDVPWEITFVTKEGQA